MAALPFCAEVRLAGEGFIPGHLALVATPTLPNNALHRDDGCPLSLVVKQRSVHFSFIAVAGELDSLDHHVARLPILCGNCQHSCDWFVLAGYAISRRQEIFVAHMAVCSVSRLGRTAAGELFQAA
jgi:hypothetical protein